jgi:RNA recognition motif-containing protein
MGLSDPRIVMAKRLYVGNLSFATTPDELRALFEKCGHVKSVQVMNDRDTGRSRGFGFVEMVDSADADAAIDQIDGQEFAGRRLNVSDAKPREPGTGDRGRPDLRGSS